MTNLFKYLFLLPFLFAATSVNAQQSPEGGEDNTTLVKVDKTNPDAVVLEKPDRYSDPVTGVDYHDEVEVLDEEEKGGYVKVRVKVDGEWKEGWIKKSVLGDDELVLDSEAAEAEGASSSAQAEKGSVGMEPIDTTGMNKPVPAQDPWENIDPVSAEAKLTQNPVPYHLIVPAGLIVVGGGVAIALALDNDESDPEPDPDFELLTDSFSVTCGQSMLIYPLQNDVGTGLIITGINDAPAGVVLINDTTISIPASLSEDAQFSISVEDEEGQTGISTVNVSIEAVEIAANDDIYFLNQGDGVTGNVLENDLCFNCEVIDFSGETGILEMMPNGDFEFFSPEDFWGEAVYTITIKNPCGAEDTSELLFVISPTNCDLVLINDTVWVNAGETIDGNVLDNDICTSCVIASISDAEGTLEWNPQGNFTYTAPDNFGGQVVYVVSIVDACDQEGTQNLVIIVENPPCAFEWAGQIDTTPASCGLDDGSAFATEELFGPYNFSWSNGVDFPENEDIPAGSYQLFVTDTTTGCIDTLVAEIEELPPDYMLDAVVDPGSCGAIDGVVLNSNASVDNALTIVVSGASSGSIEGVTSSSLILGDFVPLNPGNLTIEVYSIAAGPDCTEEIQLVLEQSQLPDFVLNDDVVEVDAGEMASGNLLDNDICDGCTVQSVSDGEGELDWQSNGEFNYSAPDENVEVEFIVTVTDVCGQEDTQTLTFLVQVPAPCGFDWNGIIETEPADCGLSNGSAVATGELADFVFTWSNGLEGPENENLPAGDIQLIVNNTDSGCSDTLEATVDELPPDYELEVEIVPGECGATDNMLLFSNASPENPLTIDLSGSTVGIIENLTDSPVILSDFVALNPGDLIITVWADNAGPECSQLMEVTLNQAPLVEVIVLDVVQPQPPDPGMIVIDILNAVFPAEIFVNGSPVMITETSPAFLEGLLPGNYEIHAVDVTGCASPIVVVVLEEGGGIQKPDGPVRWTPQTMGLNNWIYSPQQLMLQTVEGQEGYFPVGAPTAVPVFFEMSKGQWVATGAMSSIVYQTTDGPGQVHRVNYFEIAAGSKFEFFGNSISLKLGSALWNPQADSGKNVSGWFIDGTSKLKLKSSPGRIQLGFRAGIIETSSEIMVMPNIQYTISE